MSVLLPNQKIFILITTLLSVVVVVHSLANNSHPPTTQSIEGMPRVVSTVSVVSDSHVSNLGEGPYWHNDEKLLYYIDAFVGELHRLNPATGDDICLTLPNKVSIIIPYTGESGQFIVSSVNKLLKLDWTTGRTKDLATVSPHLNGRERFNDAKCDPKGRIFIGTILGGDGSDKPVVEGGSLYKLEGSEMIKVTTGFTITNGMAWSNDPEAKKFYLNDSEGRKVYVFDYDIENGTLSNKTVLIDCDNHPDFVPDEYPDGMAIDRFGFLWIAMWNGRRVIRVNPETARIVDQVVFSRVQIPSSVAFGEFNGKFGLYVTTATTGISPEKIQDDGKIHHITIHGGEIRGFDPSAI